MKIKIVELSSGFANVPNSIIFEKNYSDLLQGRSGSAYDRRYTIDIPEGFTITENNAGEATIWNSSNHDVELSTVNHGRGWITGVSLDGFHRFPIVEAN